jgi:hypothetical protein
MRPAKLTKEQLDAIGVEVREEYSSAVLHVKETALRLDAISQRRALANMAPKAAQAAHKAKEPDPV